MITIAICDDFELDRKHLTALIQDYCAPLASDIRIMNFTAGEDLVAYCMIENISFDIIFLDIYMSGDNGINTAKKIRELDSECKIVFTTTSTEHALDSFSVFPFNYLTKPVTREVFKAVFEKAIHAIDRENQKSLTVKTEAQIHTVPYKDIKSLESVGRKINMHTTHGVITFYSKLDDIEAKMNDHRFLRCHKSFLVNMDYIASVENYSFILTDNTEIAIKQRNFASVKKQYFSYVFDKANFK